MAFYNELNRFKENTACIDSQGRQLTYGELSRLADELGEKIRPRTLVFILCSNTIGSVAGYISCLQHSAVPLLLKENMDQGLRCDLTNLYQPAYLYIPAGMKTEFDGWTCTWEAWEYCLLENPNPVQTDLFPQLALLLTTSGSTGSPKLVRQSYQNIQSNAQAIAEYLKLDETERPVTSLPMNYTYGLSIINSHLLAGAAVLLTEDTLMDRSFWDFFVREKATSFGGVPYTYEMLKKLHFFQMDLPDLRTMTQAGGKLSPQLHKEFAEYAQEHGKHFVVMYGQTEATARMAYLPWEKAIGKYGSMGIAIPGGRLWLKDIDGNEIKSPDVTGELVYEGTNVTLGYAECPADLERGDERHGILETGDMARKDEEGYFYITGRKKRFLKIYGNRVNLDEIERMVKAEYPEAECACAGVDDKLYTFVNKDNVAVLQNIKHLLSEKTGLNMSAFHIKFLAKIPKNEAGKTLYQELEEYYD